MRNVGIVGIGDMGSGMAKNLIGAGYAVLGHDLLERRRQAFVALGGTLAGSAAAVGEASEAVFVMVMHGADARGVILGDETRADAGLISSMRPGSTILLSATVTPAEAREIAGGLEGSGIELIDTPVSGGYPGAQGGTLTLMTAGDPAVIERNADALAAISGTIHRGGEQIGMGQTVKACLQSLIGAIFSATFETSVLAAKAGVDGDVLRRVVATSSAGCTVADTSLENIVARRFENTGSHIRTMYKDLTIVMDMARELGVPLFTAATAMQLFQAGITKYPDGDNWSVARLSEEIVGAGLGRD